MNKITLATVKSFINKNRDNLLIKTESRFDGMHDCVMSCANKDFKPAIADNTDSKNEQYHFHTQKIVGAWFVGDSRDYFTQIQENGLTGFRVDNCCGSFSLAVQA